MTSQPDPSTPRLADRLSALVGQATSRQDDTATSERFLTAIVERLGEISEEVGLKTAAIDSSLRTHVDEVGGALVLRLDEVASSLNKQVTEVELGLRDTLAEAAKTQTEQPDLRVELTKLAEELRHVREDLAASQAATASLTAELGAVSSELSALQAGVSGMSSQLSVVEESLGRRVDEAALALAETLVALLAPGDAALTSPTTALPTTALPTTALPTTATEVTASSASPEAETSSPTLADEAALADEEAIQAVGVDDGSALAQDHEPSDGSAPVDAKKRGLFRR